MAFERNIPGGSRAVWEAIKGGKLDGIRLALRLATTDPIEIERLLQDAARRPLSRFMSDAQMAILQVLAHLIPERSSDDAKPNSKPVPIEEYLAELYSYGTGWLGLSPNEVWNSSVHEIEIAFLAHVDKIIKMTPGSIGSSDGSSSVEYSEERLKEIDDLGYDPEFDRSKLHAFKIKHGC